MNSSISNKDKRDWKNFLSSNDKIHNKDEKFLNKKASPIKSFDLHGYSLDEANIKISEFIKDSYEKGSKKLIIVTGKGIHSKNEKDPYISKNLGILKYSVPEYIKNSSFNWIRRFCQSNNLCIRKNEVFQGFALEQKF